MLMIEASLIIALIIYFIKSTTWKGMIFESVGKWVEAKLGEKWSKPITGCPVCMTPWWGFVWYTIGHFSGLELFQEYSFFYIIFVLFSAAGINTVVLMLNKNYDVAKKEDKILEKEIKDKKIK